jgi:predicted regulator of Ras-like GTPase activity (Roadblock/LC7/MglB family)
MYVMGGPPKGVHRETFAAMSAIILGAAETTSTELKDKLTKVVIELTEQNLILIGVGPKYLVVVTADRDADHNKIALDTKDMISRVETAL